jgi:hypothetical protein
MKRSRILLALMAVFTFSLTAFCLAPCRYLKSRSGLGGYERGGPYKLEHFHLTNGRTDLRDFLWNHWHNHIKGVAVARVGTIDAGTVTVLYVLRPDSQGRWGIDVEIGRPRQPPPCSAFHVDGLVRFPVRKPDEDYPSQTLGPYLPHGMLPQTRLADSDVKDAKYWKLILVENGKSVGDTI